MFQDPPVSSRKPRFIDRDFRLFSKWNIPLLEKHILSLQESNLLPCVSLPLGHHSQRGFSRLVYSSEKNIFCTQSETWRHIWPTHKSQILESVRVTAALTPPAKSSEILWKLYNFISLIDEGIKGWILADIISANFFHFTFRGATRT